jgi:hypothetical protein
LPHYLFEDVTKELYPNVVDDAGMKKAAYLEEA